MDTWQGSSEDPITLHKYVYAYNNPPNVIDPSGNVGLGSLLSGISNQARVASGAVVNYSRILAGTTARFAANSTLMLTRNSVVQANRMANAARTASQAGRRAGAQTVNAGRAIAKAVRAFKRFSRSDRFKNATSRHYIDLWGPTSISAPN